jgi:hypothetical protein
MRYGKKTIERPHIGVVGWTVKLNDGFGQIDEPLALKDSCR